MTGQRGSAARAVGNNLEALVQQTLVPDGLQCQMCIRDSHILFQLLVDVILVDYREVTQMDTLGSGCIIASYQILVNILGHEGDHGCGCLTDVHQCGVQRHVGIDLILLHALCPETLTAASYIPVTHLIDEVLQSLGSLWDTVLVQIAVYFCNGRVQLGQQPLIHYGQFVVFQCIFCLLYTSGDHRG